MRKVNKIPERLKSVLGWDAGKKGRSTGSDWELLPWPCSLSVFTGHLPFLYLLSGDAPLLCTLLGGLGHSSESQLLHGSCDPMLLLLVTDCTGKSLDPGVNQIPYPRPQE